MDKSNQKLNSIPDYISKAPEEAQDKLTQLYEIIKKEIPESTEEAISYKMPTFKLNGKYLIYFAGFKKHISIFPFPSGIEEFKEETKDYATSTGTIQFPLDQDLPVDLIKRIVKFRVAEVTKTVPTDAYGRAK